MVAGPGGWYLLLNSAVGSFHVTLNPVHLHCVGILEKVLVASLVQVLHSGCHSRELLFDRVLVEHVPF